jgi:hypothetical protein
MTPSRGYLPAAPGIAAEHRLTSQLSLSAAVRALDAGIAGYGSSSGNIEAGLAEKPDHMLAKFAD